MTITVTAMYPNTPGSKFDMDYYLGSHLEMVGKHLGESLVSKRVVKGLGTVDPDTPAPYQVMAIIEIDSMNALQEMLREHGEEILGDIPNFTDVAPIIQISENLG